MQLVVVAAGGSVAAGGDQPLLPAPMNINERYFIDFINNHLTQFAHMYFAGYF